MLKQYDRLKKGVVSYMRKTGPACRQRQGQFAAQKWRQLHAQNRACLQAKAGSVSRGQVGSVCAEFPYYLRDAQGNNMATYERIDAETTDELFLTEQYVYGSSRVGYVSLNYEMVDATPSSTNFVRKLGEKRYELSNHLGNVLAVVTDRLFAYQEASPYTNHVKYYEADVIAAQDYDPFGMLTPGRSWEAGSGEGYRFGFNNQEQVDEVYGNGNLNTALFWEYDTRLGRRWNIDPVVKTSLSPYACFNNNPIQILDPLGNDGVATVDSENHTVTVNVKFYYDNSNGKTVEAVGDWGSLLTNDWTQSTHSIIDDDGLEWNVTYQIEFIPLANKAEVDRKLADDVTANAFRTDLSGFGAGHYANRVLNVDPVKYDRSVFEHEFGHAIGLVHSQFVETGPFSEGVFSPELPTPSSNPFFADSNNGFGDIDGPIMSYANNRVVAEYEVRLSVINAIKLSHSNGSNVAVHIKGHDDNADDEIIY